MKYKKLFQLLLLIFSLVIFLGLTDPFHIPLPLLLVPYLLIGVIIYKLISATMGWFLQIKTSKNKLFSMLISILLTNFLLLKSIGQLTLQDVLISLAIVAVSTVYIGRFSLDDQR